MSYEDEEYFDAVVVGAGFSGIYQLYRLRQLGLRSVVIDQAGDVGGTWYWNRYPGAMSDTESYVYRFSWDRSDLLTYPWKDHYVKQPEVLAYLEHVVERHDLRRDMRFNTQLLAAEWSDTENLWRITVTGEKKLRTRYLITGLGLLSKQNYPDIPGLETFQGEMYHTAKWPKDLVLEGKRVGVIGSGSTGVQVVTELGRRVGELISYQRHPQYSVPSGDKRMTRAERDAINESWDDVISRVRNSVTGFGFEESDVSYHDASPEERERVFEKAWRQGNGFRFMFGTFRNVAYDEAANKGAQDFIRRKIDTLVKDPEKARKLKPNDLYARRPLCDGNADNEQSYFEQFNRPNVDIVDLKETPIEGFEARGIRTVDGTLREHDVVVFATGFDAVEGNYTRIAIRGREGRSLKEEWDREGPTAYLGCTVPGFPNLFLISGPKGPFTNVIPGVEAQIEFISEAIARAGGREASAPIEATGEAEQEYSAWCEELASTSLFWHATDNWIFGTNIPGKRRCLRFFFGGMKMYRERLADEAAKGYPGFRPFVKEPVANGAGHGG